VVRRWNAFGQPERAAEDLNDAELPDPDGDAPDIRIEHIETPPAVLGTKGVWEAGAAGVGRHPLRGE